jgi:uncharacterized protein YggE
MRVVPVLVALVLVASLAAGEERPDDKRRTIAVSGQGEAKAPPDRVLLSFAVETTAARAGETAAENARRSQAVVAAVKPQLDARDTVTTTRYTIEPRYEGVRPGERQEPRITGYVARNEVQVESQRVDKAGALIDAATAAGANRVSALQFTVADRTPLQRAAIEKAGADARAQAESVARGLGVRLGPVLSASTQSAPIPYGRRFEAVAMAEARAAPTPIEPGEVAVSATLHVTYGIE